MPLGEEAIRLERYLREARGDLLGGRPSDVLFPSLREQMTRQTFWHRISITRRWREEAIGWLERYLREARGDLLGGRPSDVLFPSLRGEQMTRQTFWHRISITRRWRRSARRFRRTPCVTPSPPTCSTMAPTCVTPSPPTCSTMAPTCGWCRCCSATATCRPPRSIPISPGPASRICTHATTREADALSEKSVPIRKEALS